jgi:osmotically-inducible protein OsmY
VEKAMHLLVLGLALAVACSAQSSSGVGQSQAAIPSPSPSTVRPVEPVSPEHVTSGAAESADSPSEGTVPAVAKQTEAAELESQIQNALGKDPTLIHDSVRVAVSQEAVELTGNVATSRERLTATRIAQSYAGSKRVVSRITVAASPQDSGTPEKKNASGSQRQLRR